MYCAMYYPGHSSVCQWVTVSSSYIQWADVCSWPRQQRLHLSWCCPRGHLRWHQTHQWWNLSYCILSKSILNISFVSSLEKLRYFDDLHIGYPDPEYKYTDCQNTIWVFLSNFIYVNKHNFDSILFD